MKFPKLILPALALAAALPTQAGRAKDKVVYKDASAPVEKRVEDLLSRMTLKEKIMQINQNTLGDNFNENNLGGATSISAEIGSIIYYSQDATLRNTLQKRAVEETRLGIPILFGFDVIHGFRTIFPIPLAQSCSWNPELVKQSCSVAARESRASGVDWTFSPMVDVARDPRWGRVAEGYGEDPYTASVYARAAVEGYQGPDLKDTSHVASCLKHFVGYGASEAGLDYVYTEISRHSLWNTYLRPFEAGVEAGTVSLMSSFNDISGTPATSNHYTLTDVLRKKWRFKGILVSDWTAVVQLINQGVAADRKEAAEKALNAGLDIDMVDNCYRDHLEQLLKEKKVSMARIDEAVRRVLTLKFQLGLFERPYTPVTDRSQRLLHADGIRLAEQLAEESMVLLKNHAHVLPLQEGKRIALVGPMATNKEDLLGSWYAHGNAADVCSIEQALKEEMKGKAEITVAEGCNVEGTDPASFRQAIETVRNSDVAIVCLGEKRRWSGENAPRANMSLPSMQEELVREAHAAGKPVVLIVSAGRPIDLSRVEPLADAIVWMWQPGIVGGRPLARILDGQVNPSGKLSITFPQSVAQVPIYYNRKPAARKAPIGLYLDMTDQPLYEFGHGLSYTTFSYGPIQSSNTAREGQPIRFNRTDGITLSIPVTNTGQCEGKETVMWYVTDPACTVSRPVKELCHFEKKSLKPGETATFTFHINPLRDLSYRDEDGNRIVEDGTYIIRVGNQSIRLLLEK